MVVLLMIENLGRHIIQSSDICLPSFQGILKLPGFTNITNFYLVVRSQKNIHGLDITMQDLIRVKVLQPETNLNKDLPDFAFFAFQSVGLYASI